MLSSVLRSGMRNGGRRKDESWLDFAGFWIFSSVDTSHSSFRSPATDDTSHSSFRSPATDGSMMLDLPGRAISKAYMSSLPSVPFHIPHAATTLTFPLAQKVLSIARGGGGSDAAVDLTRIGMKLSAMSSYALISSLLLGSGLYLFAITPLKVNDVAAKGREGKIQRSAISLFSVLVAVTIATSLHTTITFNVMTLYANTALGQGLDAEFLKFWNSRISTALRKNAFFSFVAAIQTFKLSFALSVFLKSDGNHRWVATIAALGIMLASSFAFWQMIGVASLHIFKH